MEQSAKIPSASSSAIGKEIVLLTINRKRNSTFAFFGKEIVLFTFVKSNLPPAPRWFVSDLRVVDRHPDVFLNMLTFKT